MKAKPVDVNDSFDAILVNDDRSAKAHKVIPNAINYYTLTQGYCTERSFEQSQHYALTDSFEEDITEE